MARIAVLRTDMDNARVTLGDLESKAQESFDYQEGQVRTMFRPTLAAINTWRTTYGITAVTAATILASTVDTLGSPDVSIATITALDASILALYGTTPAAITELQDILAPLFLESEAFKISFRTGVISAFGSATFSYADTVAPMFVVLENDGVTAYHLD